MERLDSNYILNAIFQSGGTVDVREDSNYILNTVFDADNNALKVGLSGDINVGAVSASTIYSGGTDLYDIFITSADGNDITRVQPGTNITTGGTANEPIVNLADNVIVTNISATTFYSGSTELSTLFGTGAGTVTSVSAGDANIEIGGTAADPTVSLADSPSLNNVTASGLTTTQTLKVDGLNGASERFLSTTDGNIAATYEAMDIVGVMSAYTGDISCANLSATTIYSGSTNLYSIFANASHTHTTANVTNLDNLLATKANLSAATFTGAVTIPIATSNLSGAGYTSQGFAISDETTAIASAATASLTYYAPFTMKITDTFACLSTSGSTSSTFDIHLTGTTIFSTKITIDANEFTTDTAATAAVITGTTITKGQKVEFFIDAAGTGAKGAKIFINGYKA